MASTRDADGCWGLALPTEPHARLARLGERCAEGAAPLFPAPRRLDDGTSELALPPVPDGTCVRVAAVSAGSPEVSLLGEASVALASDADAAFALAPLRGPLCPRGGGAVKVRVTNAGKGPVWLQAWATAPTK